MKKIMLILVITGVLISCSNKDQTVKKETVVEVAVVKDESVVPVEKTVVETTEVAKVEIEKPVLTDKDYKLVSEPVKKLMKKSVKQIKYTPEPVEKEIDVEEKLAPVEVVMETSVDETVDTDVDKQIAKTETETKVVKVETPAEESSSNKTLFGILGAILVAVAAIFVFKKK
ncbi:MAG: hypothetical protein B6227_00890 [Fusobacteriia bacterium 4572_74]|nr:MAG: hypothetical protein B6227_00890 [Fusobacteriia bacterium 4572_74]